MKRHPLRATNFKPNQTVETMLSKSNAQFEKMAQEAANMSRENVDAFVKSGALLAKGFEELSRTAMATGPVGCTGPVAIFLSALTACRRHRAPT